MNALLSFVDVLFLACVLTLIYVEALPYKFLDALQFQNCPQKNRCSLIGNATFSERLCECDSDECTKFGDCCIDVATLNSKRTASQMCMHYGNFTHQGIYVFNTCPINFSGSNKLIENCTEDVFSDPLASAPVTDTSSGATYLNRYCALCNGVSLTSMDTWKLYFACDDEDLDINDISWEDIKYDPDLKKWGYDSHGKFNPCKFVYDKPLSVSVAGRLCRSNVISSCSNSWTRSTYRRECEIYMALVTNRANRVYKNPHCAMCNDIQEKDLMCLVTSIADRTKIEFSYALMVDFNTNQGDVVGVTRSKVTSCPGRQKFDPFFKKCRTLRCGLPGLVIVDGKCVKQ